MSKMSNIAAFVAGAAVGSVAVWQYFKKKYERIAQEEIDSVKAVYSAKTKEPEKDELEADRRSVEEYVALLKKQKYIPEDTVFEEGKEKNVDRPYVITPEEFNEFDDYECITLFYYSDQVLADDNGDLIDDVDELIGFESLAHFGEYEEDAVYVRNDERKCDYEILKEYATYSESLRGNPHQVEV